MDDELAHLEELVRKERREVEILKSQLVIAKEKTNRKRQRYQITQSNEKNNSKTNSNISGNLHPEKTSQSAAINQNDSQIQMDLEKWKEKDLLDLLDALGSQNSDQDKGNASLSENGQSYSLPNHNINFDDPNRWQHQDADSFRLLPLLGGIYFTQISHRYGAAHSTTNTSNQSCTVKPPPTKNDKRNQYGYDMKGNVLIGNYAFHIYLCIAVESKIEQKLGKATAENLPSTNNPQAQVDKLKVEFAFKEKHEMDGQWIFPHQELEELASIARKTKNITQMFRNLVTFSEFDLKRGNCIIDILKMIHKSKNNLSIQRESADRFHLRANGSKSTKNQNGICILLEWKFLFSLFGRGVEELVLVDIDESKAIPVEDSSSDNNIQNRITNEGLQALIECNKGSCEKALKMLVESIIGKAKKS